MRKIKIAMLSFVVILAIGGAYAGGPGFFKESWKNAISKTEKKADPTRDLTVAEMKACDCTQFQQYYECSISPRTWCEVNGEPGNGYTCQWCCQVCTYYRPNPVQYPNYYAVCTEGVYWPDDYLNSHKH
jgi:hypothetical protein